MKINRNKLITKLQYILLAPILAGLFYFISEDSICPEAVAVEGFLTGVLFIYIKNKQHSDV